METKNLLQDSDDPTVDWEFVSDRLDRGVTQAPGTGGPDRHTCWLATIAAHGRPHVTGVGALWVDGAFWFETGERTGKGRDLARHPRCSLTLSTAEFSAQSAGPPPWRVYRLEVTSATALQIPEPYGATRWTF